MIRPLDPTVVNDGHRWAKRWLDREGTATLSDVQRLPEEAWSDTSVDDMLPLKQPARVWYRLRLPKTSESQYWFLSVPVPGINSVTLHSTASAGADIAARAGDLVATDGWPIPERYPTFALPESHNGPITVYLEVARDINSSVPITLSEGSVERRELRNADVLLGFYFGVVVGCLFVALLRLSMVREPAFAIFAIYAVASALTQASITGLGGVYLWPHSGALANGVSLMLPILMAATGLVAMWELSAFRTMSARLGQVMLGTAIAGLVAALATAWLPFAMSFWLAVSYTVYCTLLPVPTFIYAARRGNRYAVWGLIAFLPVLAGAAFPILRNLELISSGFWTQYSLTLGSGIHLPLLLMVLEQRRRARYRSTSRGLYAEQTDPLTGMSTTSLLLERIAQSNRRCVRFRHEAALLLVDTLNFQDLVVDHGLDWHDRILVEVASRISGVARDIDIIARVDGTRFVVLAEGPMSRSEANAMAGRLIALGLRFSKRLPENARLEFGVTIGMITPINLPADDWLAHLREASKVFEDEPGRRIAFTHGVPLRAMPAVEGAEP